MTNNDKSKSEKVIRSFDELILLVGDNGWRNYIIFFAAAYSSIPNAFNLFSYQFIGATPGHWCHVEPLLKVNWTHEQIKDIAIPYTLSNGEREYSGCQMYALDYVSLSSLPYEEVREKVMSNQVRRNETVQCSTRQFEEHVQTIVNQWDLVCEKRGLYSTTQAASQAGRIVSALIGGYLVDKLGRAYIYRIGVVILMVANFATAVSPNIFVFVAWKFVSSGVGLVIFFSVFVLCMELCSIRQRTNVTAVMIYSWCFGIALTPLIAYLVRPWVWLQIVYSISSVITLVAIWIIPESPRWLIIKGRHQEALKILTSIAKSNQKELPSDQTLLRAMEHIRAQNTNKKDDVTSPDTTLLLSSKIRKFFKRVTSSFVDPKLRCLTLSMFFCWFSSAMVYFGVSLGSTTLSTNLYLYIFLSGVIEFPAYLILWPMMLVLGRKKSVVVLLFTCALSIFAVLALVISDKNDDYSTLRLILFLTGKFAITAGYRVLWIVSAEIFPTHLRSMIIGQLSSVASCGSLLSSYINDLVGEKLQWVPAALFGGFSVAAALVSLTFPETTGKALPDSFNAPETNSGKKEVADA